MTEGGEIDEVVPAVLDGERLDRAIAVVTGLTRSAAAGLVREGHVSVDGHAATTRSTRLEEGQQLRVSVPATVDDRPQPDEAVAFKVLHADNHVIVVDKPAGLVVHPGAGNPDGTLVNGLAHRFPDLIEPTADPPPWDAARPGIVHRLDVGTSGVMVVARTPTAYEALVAALSARTAIERRYLALVWGDVRPDQGVIDAPIGRGERDRTRMTVSAGGRDARTGYSVLVRHTVPGVTLVEARLETGRTHQVRVHFAALDHPLVGDRRYRGARSTLPLDRPFLHAHTLRFEHPVTGETLSFRAPLPEDLQAVLTHLGIAIPPVVA